VLALRLCADEAIFAVKTSAHSKVIRISLIIWESFRKNVVKKRASQPATECGVLNLDTWSIPVKIFVLMSQVTCKVHTPALGCSNRLGGLRSLRFISMTSYAPNCFR
jgi:hypothetical protein